MSDTVTKETKKEDKPRGFAAMTPERRAEVARMGGKSSKPEKRWFSRNKEAAKLAGAKGGAALRQRAQKKVAVSEGAPTDE